MTKLGRPGTPVTATFKSGRTFNYTSIKALGKVLSGTGRPSGSLMQAINNSAVNGTCVRGVYVDFIN